jgi:hypothetical protein
MNSPDTSKQLASEMASDVITTACIALALVKSRTGWKQTDRLVNKLLVLVAETQFPPTVMYVSPFSPLLKHQLMKVD